jgi:hypothetical protein
MLCCGVPCCVLQGGGFKELDDAELEEARRRRQQYKQGAEDDEE